MQGPAVPAIWLDPAPPTRPVDVVDDEDGVAGGGGRGGAAVAAPVWDPAGGCGSSSIRSSDGGRYSGKPVMI